MKTKILIGNHAYAMIKTETVSMDVLLSPGHSPADSLRETVKEMREKAARILNRAAVIESAIPEFERK